MSELSLNRDDIYTLLTSSLSMERSFNIRIECLGNSMAPFIRHKNILTISPTVGADITLKTGDIVVAADHHKKQIIIHRIIHSKNNRYLLKGDGLKEADNWFKRSDIIGRIIRIENHNGNGYTPRFWQNRIIALASRFNVIRPRLLPRTKFFKSITGIISTRFNILSLSP